MADQGKGKEGTEPALGTEATKVHVYTATKEEGWLQAEIIELNKCCTALSTKHTGITPVELFQSEFIELDGAPAGHTIAMLICGGIFKDKNQDKELIIPWSSTDHDSKINCCS
eukprot:14615577-Ditylum_brightwellii.AAC.1